MTHKTMIEKRTMQRIHRLAAAVLVGIACQSCDMLDDDNDIDTLIPEPPAAVDPNRPRPSESAPVLRTDLGGITDVSAAPVLIRGINLSYGDNPVNYIEALRPAAETAEEETPVSPITATGANAVRLEITSATTSNELEAAIAQLASTETIAVLTLTEVDGVPLAGNADDALLRRVVEELWLQRFLPAIAQDRYQPYLMLNIADGWGPTGIFQASSVGYEGWVESYRTLIGSLRGAGLNMPLVIDLPNNGEDIYALSTLRIESLLSADPEANLVIGVHANGAQWDTRAEFAANIRTLETYPAPYLITAYGAALTPEQFAGQADGDGALAFELPWSGPGDKAAYVANLEAAASMIGAQVSFDVYVPAALVEAQEYAFKLYFKDSDYRYANVRFESVSQFEPDSWNTIRYTLTGNDDLEYATEDFDLGAVIQVGFELEAYGAAPPVAAALLVDNLTIASGGAPAVGYEANFNDGTEGWQYAYGTNSDITAADGNLEVLPAWAAEAENRPRSESPVNFPRSTPPSPSR